MSLTIHWPWSTHTVDREQAQRAKAEADAMLEEAKAREMWVHRLVAGMERERKHNHFGERITLATQKSNRREGER